MSTEIIVALVGVALVVAALAFYVIAIGLSLSRLSRTLDGILGGLQSIRDQTAPAGGMLSGIVADVAGIEGDLAEALEAVAELTGTGPSRPTSMAEAVAVARLAPPRESAAEVAVAESVSATPTPARHPMRTAVARARTRVSSASRH